MALPLRHPRVGPRARTLSGLLGGALVVAVVAGCSPDLRVDPLTRPEPVASCTESPTMTSPSDLPASLVPGLTISTQSDEMNYVHAATPVLPGATALNDRLHAVMESDLSRYRTDLANSPQAGSVGAGELNLSWDLVGVSAGAVGVMLSGQRKIGPTSAGIVHVLWWDPVGQRLLNPGDLFTPEGWSALTARLTTDLCAGDAAHAPVVAQALSASDQAGAASAQLAVAFAQDGSAVLTVTSTTPVSEPLPIVLGADQVQPWLSAAGRAAVAAATRPQTLIAAKPQLPGPPVPSKPAKTAQEELAEKEAARKQAAKEAAKKEAAKKAAAKKEAAKKAAAKKAAAQRAKDQAAARPRSGKVDCRKVRCVALTFDDGPGPYTSDLVAKLRAAHAPATFFMMGEHVNAFPSLAKQVSRAGFEIGNHSYSHPDLTRLKSADADSQVTRTSDAIQRATGRRPTLMRPPYGARNGAVDRTAAQNGLTEVLWDVDTLDWKHRNVKVVQKTALRETRRGSIVLLHDIHPTTVQAVPGLITSLRQRGYTLVTVSELLGSTAPGSRHFRAG